MKVELKYLRFVNSNDAIFKTDLPSLKSIEIKYKSCEISITGNCFIVNTVNRIVVILVKIFKTNGFYTTKYLMSRYPLANC